MAIAFGTAGNSGGGITFTSGNPAIYNFNPGTLTQGMLMVNVVVLGDNTTNDYLTGGVTFNGTTMTQIAKAANGQTGSPLFQAGYNYLYYLANPSSGAHDIAANFTAGQSSSTLFVAIFAASYSGVAQTNPIDVSNTGHTTTSSPLTVSVTTTVANDWIVGAWSTYQGTTTYDQTNRSSIANRGGIGDSNGTVSVGSNSQSISLGGNWYPGFVIAAIKPYVAPPNSNFQLFF